MKRTLQLSLCLFLLITALSCKKKSAESNLNGTWELRGLIGSQTVNSEPDLRPGNGTLLKFNGQNFEKYATGKLIETGTFTLQPENTTVNNTTANYSILMSTHAKQYLYLSGKTLIVFDGVVAADGTQSTYVKQ